MSQSQDLFRVEISKHDDRKVTLSLVGDLDLVSMPAFAIALAAVATDKPRHLVLDLTAAEFVSSQGFVAIGRCSQELERVTVRSRSGLALRVFRALGYDDIECIDARSG
jgi:anti-anti-sigma factor